MKRIRLWHWGALIIFGAMLALIYMSWTGLKGQKALVWDSARSDCKTWAKNIAADLYPTLERYQGSFTSYQNPPTPGAIDFTPDANQATLEKWSNDGGKTKAGLPVRVLARLAILKQRPSHLDAHALLQLACQREPSVITPNIIDSITEIEKEIPPNKKASSTPINFSYWKSVWQSDENARTVASLHLPRGGHQFVNHNGQLWFLEHHVDDRTSSYASPDQLARLIHHLKSQHHLPRWADLEIGINNATVGQSGQELANAFIQQPYLNISVGVSNPELLEKNWRRTRNSNIMMIALASAALIAGITVVAIGEAKENRRIAAQNNFIASVTHELRAPVGSMRLMAEALEAQKVEPHKIPEFHRHIAREGSRLSTLIENVLDLSKIEAGQSKHLATTTNLAKLVSSAAETLRMQADEKNVTIKLTGNDMDVSVDPLHFQQALVNLIDNAVKFSPPESTVTVRWERRQHQWQISITDQGPGVPKGQEQQIFNRFYRAGNEMKRETQGAGIGLNLVKHVVRSHGGNINVSNDQGATFTLTFPILHPNQQSIS